MIIGVGNNDVILCINCNAGWFRKLAFEHPELAKLQTRENIEVQTKVKMLRRALTFTYSYNLFTLQW